MADNYKKMYSKTPAYILGFHGCRVDTFNNVVYNNQILPSSQNSYDWLGSGIYFWEYNYERASEWAKNRYGNDGRVVGAIIDLGYCLDLTDMSCVEIVKDGYLQLLEIYKAANKELPQNRSGSSPVDKLVRNLDCSVINTIHLYNKKNNKQPYDSVRGMFEEGDEMYPNSGFKEKTHTQVCIVNPNCIKGFFIPRELDESYPLP